MAVWIAKILCSKFYIIEQQAFYSNQIIKKATNKMLLKKSQIPILIINILSLIIFTFFFLSRGNYEFLFYVGVIIFFLALIVLTNNKVNYPDIVLWGLTLWSILHMSGGGIIVNGKVLYSLILFPIVGEPYLIFKYDQLVHIIGFGVATLAMYYLLEPSLKDRNKLVSLSIIIVMAGLGVGALNEIIEFFATVVVPSTGVGGYENTSLDLVSDLVGALIALWYVLRRK